MMISIFLLPITFKFIDINYIIIIYGEIFLPKFFVLGKTQFGEKKLNHQRKTEKNLIQFFASK